MKPLGRLGLVGVAANYPAEDAEQSAGEAHNRSFTVVLMSGRQQDARAVLLFDIHMRDEAGFFFRKMRARLFAMVTGLSMKLMTAGLLFKCVCV